MDLGSWAVSTSSGLLLLTSNSLQLFSHHPGECLLFLSIQLFLQTTPPNTWIPSSEDSCLLFLSMLILSHSALSVLCALRASHFSLSKLCRMSVYVRVENFSYCTRMGNERVVEYLQEASKISSHLSESSSSLQRGFDGQREKCRTVFFNVSDTLIKEPSQHLRCKTDGLPSALSSPPSENRHEQDINSAAPFFYCFQTPTVNE